MVNTRSFSTNTESDGSPLDNLEVTDVDKYELWTTDATYGLLKAFDPIKYFMADQWLYISEELGLGMGMGIFLTSIGIRLIFTPLIAYAQKNGLKYRLVKDDIKDIKARMQQLKNDPAALGAENYKIKELKKKHGIRPSVAFLNMLQLPIHISAFLL